MSPDVAQRIAMAIMIDHLPPSWIDGPQGLTPKARRLRDRLARELRCAWDGKARQCSLDDAKDAAKVRLPS